MKPLTQNFVVGQALTDVCRHLTTILAEASRGVFKPAQVSLIVAPAHTGNDLAFRCFELARPWKMKPVEIAAEIAASLKPDSVVAAYHAAGPYLNIDLRRDAVMPSVLGEVAAAGESFGCSDRQADEVVMMEYISPNTNKPLHLGHVRNGVLGRAVARLIESQGARVHKTSIVNDRGIHITKSMLAYERWGGDSTPESSGVKGDHFVGGFYVRFEQELQKEKKVWYASHGPVNEERVAPGDKKTDGKKTSGKKADDREAKRQSKEFEDRFNAESELLGAAREMLRQWEKGDTAVRALWRKMNEWVFAGFSETYDKLGLDFDRHFYESAIYQGGKDVILEAEKKGIFKTAPNGAIIAPLSEHSKLQDKAVLRGDGTGLYITQDINLATIKFKEYGLTKSLYCIASEQNYYMKQLIATLRLLEFPWAEGLYHLSYGMVYLPDGKMKSREGKVVDADNLMQGMSDLAREELLKRDSNLPEEELKRRGFAIGLGAVTFHLLMVGRDTEIHFDPQSSLAFEGKTGPYLQYAYARVSSILRKAGEWQVPESLELTEDLEWRVLFQVMLMPTVLADAAETHDPMRLSSYLYELAQTVSSFYQAHQVLISEEPVRSSRLAMLSAFRTVLGNGLGILAIEALEEM